MTKCALDGLSYDYGISLKDKKDHEIFVGNINQLFRRLEDAEDIHTIFPDLVGDLTVTSNFKKIDVDTLGKIKFIKEKVGHTDATEAETMPLIPSEPADDKGCDSCCDWRGLVAAGAVGARWVVGASVQVSMVYTGYMGVQKTGEVTYNAALASNASNATVSNPDYTISPSVGVACINAGTGILQTVILLPLFYAAVHAPTKTKAAIFFALGLIFAALSIAGEITGNIFESNREKNVAKYLAYGASNKGNLASFHAPAKYPKNVPGQVAITAGISACYVALILGYSIGRKLFKTNKEYDLIDYGQGSPAAPAP